MPIYDYFDNLQINQAPRFYRCEPGWHWSPPPLPDYDLWCVAGGEGEMLLGEKRFALHAGMGFVLPPGSSPRATQNSDRRLHVYAVHFAPMGIVHASLPLLEGALIRDPTYFWGLAERTIERKDTQSRLAVHLMVLHLCAEATRPPENETDARLRGIIAAIQETPGRDWSVRAQASEACLSRAQYCRRFSQATGGISPAQFVVRARLDRAAQLLRETDMGIGQIADVLGYRDIFFFSRQFKVHRGVSPSEWRSGRGSS